ncbi:MAG: cation transporter [Ruminococcaceae bacterium]|nr:cation transporter [Oscillospiraceae bacterium]
MIKILSYFLIKEKDKESPESLRTKFGTICGIAGIFLNLCLFILKIIAGNITGAVSVKSDAFNSLSDAGSSLVALLGFKLASQKPDKDHPFGHGRFEYISGLVVAMIICLMGFELGKESVLKLFNPEAPVFDVTAIIILVISMLIKLYMFIYNKQIGKKYSSPTLVATATDCISDTFATGATILTLVIYTIWGINVDAYCGIILSLLIFKAGFGAIKDTISPLLGTPPEKELVEKIEKIVMDNNVVIGVHDLIIHDYGPGRRMISIHAEIPLDGDLATMHDCIDNIEKRLYDELSIHAVIHMDPVCCGDEEIDKLKQDLIEIIISLSQGFSIHDFRVVKGPSHTNLIFDVVVPMDSKISDENVKNIISKKVQDKMGENVYCVIQVDKPYI